MFDEWGLKAISTIFDFIHFINKITSTLQMVKFHFSSHENFICSVKYLQNFNKITETCKLSIDFLLLFCFPVTYSSSVITFAVKFLIAQNNSTFQGPEIKFCVLDAFTKLSCAGFTA